AISTVVRPMIALSGSWLAVLAILVTDRVGKGLRTAPRDALIADYARDAEAGRAFGFVRALDHAGAVIGAAVAAGVVYFGTDRLDLVIAVSAIPGLATIALVAFGVREPSRAGGRAAAVAPRVTAVRGGLSFKTRAFLFAIGCFTLGRIPETFLLLRGYELKMSTVQLL